MWQPGYRAALVFKPTSVFPPEENETDEAGAEYSLVHERLQLEGAWFDTAKDNSRASSWYASCTLETQR